MSSIEISILGSGGAVPVAGRYPSAHYVFIAGNHVLLDCGEGTLFRLKALGLPFGKISHIFITHLHADHVLGLPGLITAWQLTGRNRKLEIWSPKGAEALVQSVFEHTGCKPTFEIVFHVILPEFSGVILEESNWRVKTFPLLHRIQTAGFRLEAWDPNPTKHADYPSVDRDNPSIGRVLSYAFCSDTAYHDAIIDEIKGVDLLYHEATFDDGLADKAALTFHSTIGQAMAIAKEGKVKRLVVGHFSARYLNPRIAYQLSDEASSPVSLTFAREGDTYTI